MKLVIIGAGPGGYAAAIKARRQGTDVVLIERDRAGGTCLNWGCIPSKIMRQSADVARSARKASEFGVELPAAVEIRMDKLRARQRGIVHNQIAGLERHFKNLGIHYVKGQAQIENPGKVRVTKEDDGVEFFDYDNLILACGSVPASLPLLEVDGQKIISSDHALWMDEIPDSLLVVGGGVIGCEMAQIFHDLGSKVTIVEALPRLLPLAGVDQEISKNYMRYLKKIKLPFYVGHTVMAVRDLGETLCATIRSVDSDDESEKVEAEKILLATGRRPSFGTLGLEKLAVAYDSKGWLMADNYFRTNAPNVWAIGDCLGPSRIMLAHVATNEGLAAIDNISGGRCCVNYNQVPSAIFSVPEIACVGLTLEQAQLKFPDSRASDFLFRQLGKAQAMGEIDGLVRLVHGHEGRILGGHIMGPAATSLIAEISLAITNGLNVEQITKTIHAHPTLSEAIWEAAMSAAATPLHGA